jgi:hypothetical protein
VLREPLSIEFRLKLNDPNGVVLVKLVLIELGLMVVDLLTLNWPKTFCVEKLELNVTGFRAAGAWVPGMAKERLPTRSNSCLVWAPGAAILGGTRGGGRIPAVLGGMGRGGGRNIGRGAMISTVTAATATAPMTVKRRRVKMEMRMIRPSAATKIIIRTSRAAGLFLRSAGFSLTFSDKAS